MRTSEVNGGCMQLVFCALVGVAIWIALIFFQAWRERCGKGRSARIVRRW